MTYMKEEARLSKTQLGIYVECAEHPTSTLYNLPFLAKLGEGLDVERLKNAIEKVLNAHSCFKTVLFTNAEGQVMQKISEEPCDVEIFHLSDEAFQKKKKQLVRPFTLNGEHLWRFEIYITPSGRYLFEDIHHIIMDGTSHRILAADIRRAYDGEELETEVYTGFHVVEEEEKLENTPAYENARAFYAKLLEGRDTDSLPIRDVFGDKPRQGWLTWNFKLDSKRFKVLRSEIKVSTTAFFTSVMGFLIGKYNYKEESVIATVYDGRRLEKNKKVLYMLVKTMPFVSEFGGNISIPEFLKKSGNLLMESRENDLYAFEEMAEEYGVKAEINFAYQGRLLDYQLMKDSEMDVERIYDERHIENTPLLFELSDMENGNYQLHIGYRADMFSEGFVMNMARAYEKVAQEFLIKEYADDVELADAEAIAQIHRFNSTEHEFDREKTVVDLFREQVEKNPDKKALVYLDKSYTYLELDRITDIVAKTLKRKGIGKETVTGVLIPRCEYMVICALAILKAGGGYLPMDPSYPPERLNLMINDSGACMLITTDELNPIIKEEYQGERMKLQELSALEDCDQFLPPPQKEDLFILLYTSGSTGLPKGVMLEHGNISAFCNWAKKYYSIDETSRAAAYASYGFDANMFDTYPILTGGGTLYIIDENIRLNLLELQKYFNQNGITHSLITTQVGRQFALMEGSTSLKHLTLGGEKLVPLDPPSYALYNAYGPTETTILVTIAKVNQKYQDVPIGPAIDNIKLYVVDKNGKLLPPGAAGELWVSGYQVGRSYLNRPEQTAKAFTKNPFCCKEGFERIYHTGDVVRHMSDGTIQFIGRQDAQVKVRGFRIELTEIEEVIRRFEGIKDATVAAFDDSAGGKFLAAYIVSDESISVEALNQFIMEEKPPYMVPAVTMQIDEIPLNQNQKVNKRALPVPERTFEDSKEPENEIQRKIFDLVAEVIGTEKFGVDTSIYLAGLTSVGAVRLNVLLSRAFDKTVKTQDLKENDTVEKLEAFLCNGKETEVFPRLVDYALTKNQEGIFIDSMAHADSTIYNIPILLELSGDIDLDKLANALVAAVHAHPYMQTRLFANPEGDIRQKRMDDASFSVKDIEFLTVDRMEPIKENLVTPFDLMGDRLFRIKLIKAEKNYLYVEIHHIISDGTSMRIFLEDVSKAYKGQNLSEESYSGYEAVLEEEKHRNESYYEKARAYYADLLEGCDPDCLPAGDLKEQERAQSASLECYGQYVTAEDVTHYCNSHKLSVNGFFTAMFGLVLSKYCMKERTVFATIYNGRNDSRLSRTMAMLVKTYPVVCNVSREKGSQTIAEYVASTARQMMESMGNDIYSFGEISRAFDINPDVMFAYQGEEFDFDELCGEKVKLIPLNLNQVKAPLNLNIFLQKGQIRYFCEYRSDRFSRSYVEGFLDACDMAVSEFLSKQTISQVSILSDKARKKLEYFNDTEGKVEALSLPALLERQVKKHPDKTAVTAGKERLTFRQLNERANQIAHVLIKNGVKQGMIIALYMDRAVDVYAVRQGILKSGGAFLSIEPDYPDARISYILGDAKAEWIITRRSLYETRKKLLDGLDSKILLLEDLYQCENRSNLGIAVDPQSPAYCIYTSGTTGTPKGVIIEHRNLRNMLQSQDKNILAKAYVDNMSVFLGLAAITFDVSIIEEMMPLYHGQSVALATEEEIHNPILLAEMMKETAVDMMKCTPSYMQTMLEFPQSCDVLSQLQAIIIGAEPFPENLYAKMRNAGFKGKLFNSYGPTETTVTVTIDELDGEHVTIGTPAGNTKIYMLDCFDNILPPYARGELTILGDSVGRGYIGLKEETEKKFIHFHGKKGYRSGDVAYWNQDGKIVHCGRKDNQIKLRGLRVELDEIEAVMNRFAGIKQSAVIVRGEGNDSCLCGYYVADQPVDTQELINFMKKTLTDYMIPGAFVHLTAFPLTANSKVDKRALPEPVMDSGMKSGREAATSLEQIFCDIFSMALGMEKVYADDDFFALGGTSLSASKVAMKCMTEKIPVVYSDIFDYTTPEKLAAFVSGKEVSYKEVSSKEEVILSSEKETIRDMEPFWDVLQYNVPACVTDISYQDIGKVLVTGATGYLGIHVVMELLKRGCQRIYCLVRKGRSQSPESRMKMMFMYYFNETFESEIGRRIVPIDGDITNQDLGKILKHYDFDTVINCAACVKHFVVDDLLEQVNVRGVENLIRICMEEKKKLIQISTVSIAGESVDDHIPMDWKLTESRLFFGQALDNKYAESKFRAEKAVLDAVRKGLRGKVIRVGNLMSRESDGEFQINYSTNGFMKRLRAYGIIGSFPVSDMDSIVEFSPIDSTAEAVITLAGTPDQFTVFHAYNCHHVHMANVIAVMEHYGVNVHVSDDEVFQKRFRQLLDDESRNMEISPLIAYMNSGTLDRRYVECDNSFTVKALYRLGFSWPLTGERYIEQAVNALFTLGFFDGEDDE